MRTRTGYLVKRGQVYYAGWTVAGKKFLKSTGCRNRRDAESVLRKLMQPLALGDEIAVLESIKGRIEGRTAELARIEDERTPPLTIRAAWTAYKAAPNRPDSGPRTLSDYEGYLTAFDDWLEATHPDARALRDVTPAIAAEYAGHLTARGLSANSYNKHCFFLELLFRTLKEPARLTANPWEGIRRKRVVSNSRRELTIEELRAVCAAAEGELRLLLAVGLYTGLRLGDAATLRWAEVDLVRRFIRRIPNKTARRKPVPITIPLHASLHSMLAAAAAGERAEYVLPETATLYARSRAAVSKRIQQHFEKCGIKTHAPGTGGRGAGLPRAVVEVGFHSLRHSFVSLCREANAPLSVVESIVGHASPAMTRHYSHVSEMAATAAVAALPAVLADAGEQATPAPTMAPDGQLEALRAKLADLAARLNADTWAAIKEELTALALA